MEELFRELRRRNMFRVAGVYAVIGWLLVQIAGALENAIDLPVWFDGFVVASLLIGFPLALVLAWAFEMSPEGVKRTEAGPDGEGTETPAIARLDIAILVGFGIVVALAFWQQSTKPEVVYVNTDASAAPGPRAGIESENATPAYDPVAQASVIDPASIAVLPFVDLSPDGDQEYFSDGISEEILNVLVGVDGLSVASRTSAFRFKGETKSIPVIASELNVAHVLEGSVRKAGNRIRIAAQLIEAGSDVHLWSDTFDRELTVENIFDIQDEIAREIVTALASALSPDAIDADTINSARMANAVPANLDAYDLYLRVRASLYEAIDQETVEQGIVLLAQATELDPEFTDAIAEHAFFIAGLPSWNDALDRDEYLDRAWLINERALALDPDHASAVRVRAMILAGRYEWEAANAEAKRAIALAPRSSDAHFAYGLILSAQGYSSNAILSLRRAIELDTAVPLHHNFLGLAQAAAGRFEDAKHTLTEGYRYGYGGWVEGALSELYLRSGDIEAYRFAHANLYRKDILPSLSRYITEVRLAPKEGYEKALASFWGVTDELGHSREELLSVLEVGALHPIDIAHLSEGGAFARPFPLEYYPWFWGPAYDDLRDNEGFKEMMRIAKLPEHWRKNGWPDKCRPLGDDDFTCVAATG